MFSLDGLSQSGWPIILKKASLGDPNESIVKLSELIPRAKVEGDSLNLGMIHYLIANRYQKIGKHKSAIKSAQQAIRLFKSTNYNLFRLPRSYTLIAESLRTVGAYQESLDILYECLELSISKERAYDIKNYAAYLISEILRTNFGDYVKAIITLDKIFKTEIYDSISTDQKARFHLQYSIILSNINTQETYKNSLFHLTQYLALNKKIRQPSPIKWALYYGQKGHIYNAIGMLDSSYSQYNSLVRLIDEHPINSVPSNIHIEAYNNFAASHIFLNRYNEGLQWGLEALNLYHRFQIDNENLLSIIYDNIASAHSGMGALDSALVYLERSKAVLLTKNKSNIIQNSELSKYKENLLNIYRSKFNLHHIYSGNNKIDSKWNSDVDDIETLIYAYLRDQSFDRSVLSAKEEINDILKKGILISVRKNDKRSFLKLAELGKSILLAEHWNKPKYSYTYKADSLINNLKSLRYKEIELNYSANKQPSDSLEIEINYNQNNQILIKSKLRKLEISELPNLLNFNEIDCPDKSEIVYYALGPDSLYALHIDSKDSRLHSLCHKDTIKTKTKEYINILSNRSPLSSISRELRNILIEPLLLHTKTIKIVPTGSLHFLPFETLFELKRGSINSKNEYNISYTTSLSLDHQWAIKTELIENEFNVVSPQYNSNENKNPSTFPINDIPNHKFQNLSYSRYEYEKLAKDFRVNLIKDNISKVDFWKSFSSSNIFHFTGHAVLDPKKSNLSFLALSGNDTKLDNVITLSEIDQQNTNAELVVLNACNTGVGELIEGEGVFSLARSFLKAGAKSVVNSLWSIDDQSSSQITISFYKYLKEGHTKSYALAQAKRDYRNSDIPEYKKHPYYWAGLILIGNDAPVQFDMRDNSNDLIGWILAGALLLTFILGVRKSGLI